jgi:hypothetical protein
MKYENKKFNVVVGSKEYRDGYDRIFGNKKKQKKSNEKEIKEDNPSNDK